MAMKNKRMTDFFCRCHRNVNQLGSAYFDFFSHDPTWGRCLALTRNACKKYDKNLRWDNQNYALAAIDILCLWSLISIIHYEERLQKTLTSIHTKRLRLSHRNKHYVDGQNGYATHSVCHSAHQEDQRYRLSNIMVTGTESFGVNGPLRFHIYDGKFYQEQTYQSQHVVSVILF